MRSHIPLTFPSTRRALWSHTSLGEPVVLSCPCLSLSVTEQALYLAYGLSRTTKSIHCWLAGIVRVEADCSEIIICIDHLESDAAEDLSNPFKISTKLNRSSRHQVSPLNLATVENAVMLLVERSRQSNKVQLSEFLHAMAVCTFFAGANQIRCDIELDVFLPSSKFDARPIEPVSVASTALSKSVLSSDKHGVISTQYKSGYLTMDQYRKVIFLLESDPKVLTLPIIGIWVSGVELINHPYIWACCIRYMHTTQVRDRVPKPLEPFLLIHKSPLMSSAQYFDCTPDSSSLNYKLVCGGQGFSMDKDVAGKRSGLLSVKTDHQDLTSVRGLDFARLLQKSFQSDKENKLPLTRATECQMTDDSLPWSSPIPNQSHKDIVTLTVPEVSLLDECSPLRASQPERLSPDNLVDVKFTHQIADDNNQTRDNFPCIDPSVSFPAVSLPVLTTASSISNHEGSVARKITFRQSGNAADDATMYDKTVHQLTPSADFLPQNSSLFQQSQASQGVNRLLHVATQPPVATCISNHHHIPQTLLTAPCYTCHHHNIKCQCSDSLRTAPGCHTCGAYDGKCDSPGNAPVRDSLTVITANVQKLLSPRPVVSSSSFDRPLACQSSATSSSGFEGMGVSPISLPGQTSCGCESCTSPLAQRQVVPVPPEIEEILRQQDAQLKALQQQIQTLLNARKDEEPIKSTKRSTTQTATAAVNTGVSLFEGHQREYNGSTTDTPDSAHDSSQSHSLIQHDLTALDFPTQLTARSFTSDMNVDYESYDDSLTGSPKRNDSCHSRSEDSWQSPVLGESVSMMAESLNPECTKHHLDVIIKNVRDLLAKRAPEEGRSEKLVTPESSGYSASDQHIFERKVTDFECTELEVKEHDEECIHTTEEDINSHLATRNQLKRIELDRHGQIASDSVALPRLQYLSMVMTDSTLDSNKSLELNALALKYLHNDQLTELAHLTVHRGDKPSVTKDGSLLRKVLMMPSRSSSSKSTIESNNISMATQQYLNRYDLNTSISDATISPPPLSKVTATSNLKSILRKGPEVMDNKKDKSSEQEMSLPVLDIGRLKELPKLL
ncbi:SCL-interrupting locus protein homolog [Watersipora subatra]|uniref:SCL-interrupting locus protein homolog n=1 Tax=Watersipora subatra TaxID=2589382 RepID=UPI00355B32E3